MRILNASHIRQSVTDLLRTSLRTGSNHSTIPTEKSTNFEYESHRGFGQYFMNRNI